MVWVEIVTKIPEELFLLLRKEFTIQLILSTFDLVNSQWAKTEQLDKINKTKPKAVDQKDIKAFLRIV